MKLSRERAIVAALLVGVIAIGGAFYMGHRGVARAADFPCVTAARGNVVIDIKAGASGSDIAQQLRDKGVIESFDAFFRLAVGDPRSERIAPGLHSIDVKICAKDALTQLLDSARIGNLLSISEGAWNSEIKAALLKNGYSKNEVSVGFSLVKLPRPFTTLEGLLFPAQYSFDTSTSVSSIIKSMIARGSSEIRKSGIAAGNKDFNPAQLLTIASLVQAEGDRKDFSKISRVVRNRITKGMPLQFDSTVHYIRQSRGSVFLSTQSTLINSPYNTYRRYGLPPGPINNPGYEAMYAATHPDSGAWLFFITVEPGDTRFTDSLEQFNSWKVLYKKNLMAGKFRSK